MPSFTELNTVKLPIAQWLSELGWEYRSPEDLRPHALPLADPSVEPILIDAIERLNPDFIECVDDARAAIAVLRAIHHTPDSLLANETLLRML